MNENEKKIGEKLLETLKEAESTLSDSEKHYIKGVADGMLAAKACAEDVRRQEAQA